MCPDDELLARFGDGLLGEPERSALEAHLDTCDVCFRVVGAQVDAEDPAAALSALAPRYRILSELGRGGMGVVYAAHDSRLDRNVALKLMRPRDSRDEAEFRERFLKEARAAARITHPNVVSVFDYGSAGTQTYLVMELIDGTSLRRWLSSTRSLTELLRVFRDAGAGLAAAHRAGWIHRDFKPENVLISTEGRVAVGDFGLALASEEVSAEASEEASEEASPVAPAPGPPDRGQRLTCSHAVLGTPRYLSPEQRAGKPADARSDQYAFALAFYEAIHGALPGETTATPPFPRVPPWLASTLERALRESPEERFPSMDALLHALTPPSTRHIARRLASALLLVLLAMGMTLWLSRGTERGALTGALHQLGLEAPYRPELILEGNTLKLSLRVSDAKVRERFGPAFDGREEPFALVPTSRSEIWNRVELRYQGYTPDVRGLPDDVYRLELPVEDAASVRSQGVAFGLDTNLGTIWYQTRGENWVPR